MLDSADPEKNESYSSDDNIDNIKPIGYDSTPNIEECSFEDTDLNKRNYELFKEKEHATNIRREWVIPGFTDYSFQTIPTMMSLTLKHVIYNGAIFMSKEKLKTSLSMLGLKEKFEYQIRRSSKTHFKAS